MKFVLIRTSCFASFVRLTWPDGSPFDEDPISPDIDVIEHVPKKFNPKIETLTEKDGSTFEAWTVEIETLNDLLELSDATECSIIYERNDHVYDFGPPILEIYDDWRE